MTVLELWWWYGSGRYPVFRAAVFITVISVWMLWTEQKGSMVV